MPSPAAAGAPTGGHAERELRKLGRRIYRRTRSGSGVGIGIGSLTERELQVTRLVVDRRTNARIAAELFLSEKTVETHMRNIFNKMGVATRVDLARAVERAEQEAATQRDQGRVDAGVVRMVDIRS